MTSTGSDANDSLKLIKTLTEFPKDDSTNGHFILKISNFLREKENLNKMGFELLKASLSKEIKVHPSDFYLASNATLLLLCVFSLIKFKRYTFKCLGFSAFLMTKSLMLDPINTRLNYKYLGLTGNDYLSQEIRLLYQFYFPYDSINSKLKEKCEEYQQNIIKRKKMTEKYGEI